MYKPRYLPHFDPNFTVTGPSFCRPDGRICVHIRDCIANKTIQVLYSRYLVEQHLERHLSKDETVDHINRINTDDRLENLRIVPLNLHSYDDTRRVSLVKIICVQCGKQAEKSASKMRGNSKQGKAGPFCSKSCGAKYGRDIQLGIKEKLPAQPYVESSYFYNEKAIGDPILFNKDFAAALEAALSVDVEFTDKELRRQRKEYLSSLSKEERLKETHTKFNNRIEYWDPNYYGMTIHTNSSGRKFLYLVSKEDSSNRRHITYARFLMENLNKRRLDPHKECVDHIDNDCTNDNIDNLQLLTREENTKKQFVILQTTKEYSNS